MTTMLTAPPRPLPPMATARATSPWLGGVTAALWVTVAGLLLVGLPGLAAWWRDDRSTAGASQALRLLGAVWLLAGGAQLATPGGIVTLLPLGLLLVPLLLLVRAGGRLARQCGVEGPRAAGQVGLAVAVPYAAIAGVLAVLTRGAAVRATLPSAVLSSLLLAGVAASVGALRVAHRRHRLVAKWPEPRRQLLRAIAAVTAGMFGCGAVLAGLALIGHLPQAVDRAGAATPGGTGAFVLALLGLAVVPNAAVFGTSWLSGTGFAVGAGTAVTPFAVTVGALPTFPLLAAVPATSVPAWLAVAAVLVPVSVGALGGRLLRRADNYVGAVAQLAAATALLWLLLGWLSGGAVAAGRLSAVGPSPLPLALLLAVEVGIGALLVGASSALAARRRPATGLPPPPPPD